MNSSTSILFIVLLLGLLGGAFYFLYLNYPGEILEFEAIEAEIKSSDEEENKIYSKSAQFYTNMRYPNKRISYTIEDACDTQKRSKAKEAFSILNQKTILEFHESESGEIRIFCSNIPTQLENQDYFVAGEGGPSEVIDSELYAVILSGKVSFFREEKCGTPNIALHEILHALGFNHNNNPKSILYPTLACEQIIDNEIIEDINTLYSIPSLPDLKIKTVSATKSGRYLNFEIEVVNQGLRPAENVLLSIYLNDKLVETEVDGKRLDFGDISIGTKKTLEVTNIKTPISEVLPNKNDRLVFFVDEENYVEEISEINNVLELELAPK